ncbi:40S ribosomal protein S19 [Candidatus Woesearchaeota archaeon]|nr:40S ribosomal protein S19 [Candidatus Woesearchaeota archaeon]
MTSHSKNPVQVNDHIEASAEALKSKIQAPIWSKFVKTGHHKDRPPVRADWWYWRAASVLRSVDNMGPIGVSKLRTKYGGKKNRGVKPEKFYKAGGHILRTVLQQLENAKLVKQDSIGVHKGRVLTREGKMLLKEAEIVAREKAHAKQKEAVKKEPAKTVMPKSAEKTATHVAHPSNPHSAKKDVKPAEKKAQKQAEKSEE